MGFGVDLDLLGERLSDARGKRVVFVAHCMLNENARYQGGAFRAGPNAELVAELVRHGIGIVQMKCPEQQAWGGVRRPLMWTPLGRRRLPLYGLGRPLAVAAFARYTRLAWRRIARQTAREIADWKRAGYQVLGVIGVAGSPSCGVEHTLDLERGMHYIAGTEIDAIERDRFNRDGIGAAAVPGRGIYIDELSKELRRRHLDVPLFEHDLLGELQGGQVQVCFTAPA